MVFFSRLLKLPKYLSKIEKIIILILLVAVLISTSLLIYDYYSKRKIVPDFGGTYIEGVAGEIRSLIPILKQNDPEKNISKLIFSSLIKFNQKREVIGDLAEKWEISPDGKTYTFYLRQAKWQDGAEITAEDIIFTLSLIQNEETKSPFFDSFQTVEVKKIDDKTVSFNLKKPLAPFLTYLDIPILPKHLLSEISPANFSNSQFAKKPIGSGPFKLEKIEKNREGTSVILKAHEEYFLKKPYLSKFIFKIYQTQEESRGAFSKKQILGLFDNQTETGKSCKTVLPLYKAVFFNLNSASLDRDLRRALALSTNKTEILEAIGEAEKVDFPILPGFLGYKEGERWNFDLEKATKLLKSKNYPSAFVLLVKEGKDDQKIAEILKKQWENLGIKIEIVIEANAHFEKTISERNYDLLLAGVNQKADPDPYPFWHSSQGKGSGLNLSSFKNKEVDGLLEESRQSTDQNFRKQKYERFVDIIQTEVPAIFLYQPIYNYQTSDIIKGIEEIQGVTKADRFWNVENWYIKTKRVKE